MSFYSTGPLPDPHLDCGPSFDCWECGTRVCQRCEASPGEPLYCTACSDWHGGTPA